MKRTALAATAAAATALAAASLAQGTMAPSKLTAKLAGMGDKGTVTVTIDKAKEQLCWSFDLHVMGLTGATVRDAAGMTLVSLGSMYQAKGCAMASAMAIDELQAKPGSYEVWVATKAQPGDMRGTLSAGMSSMSHM